VGTKFFHALVCYGQKSESVLTLKPINETLFILQQKTGGVNVHIHGFTHNKQTGENSVSCRSACVAG
ncbi:hypothetical protein AAAV70_28595, partial [Hungatella hathewayi]|uniref:hypothetical protein n=1 Tax=Hungatella hathewayi TaxID=154046 RepID=UPI0032BF44BA